MASLMHPTQSITRHRLQMKKRKEDTRFVFRFNMEISLFRFDFFKVMVCNQFHYWAITIPNKVREMP
jgi:hypothetical protein